MLGCALALLLTGTVQADPIEDFRLWGNLTVQGAAGAKGSAGENWRLYMEVQPRFRGSGKDIDQLLLRPMVGYALSPQLTVWLGYGHILSYPAVGATVHENRIFQQVTWQGPTALGALQSRTRLEQRMVTNRNDTGWRFREMLKLTRPVETGSRISLVGFDEFFYNFNSTDWGARSGFDQNRALATTLFVSF